MWMTRRAGAACRGRNNRRSEPRRGRRGTSPERRPAGHFPYSADRTGDGMGETIQPGECGAGSLRSDDDRLTPHRHHLRCAARRGSEGLCVEGEPARHGTEGLRGYDSLFLLAQMDQFLNGRRSQ
jgi:hypothetical protein